MKVIACDGSTQSNVQRMIAAFFSIDFMQLMKRGARFLCRAVRSQCFNNMCVWLHEARLASHCKGVDTTRCARAPLSQRSAKV
jgi:hypothetical protein